MKIKRGWRGATGMAEIIAIILVLLPVVAFFLTLMLDYWTLMRIDNQLKLIAYQISGKLDSSEDLSTADAFTTAVGSDDLSQIASLCPAAKPTLNVTRTEDMPYGQTLVTAQVVYDQLNHMDDRTMQTTIRSFSYRDQNGSFLIECK